MGMSGKLLVTTALLAVFSMACEIAPQYIERSGEVDLHIAHGRYKSACVGLEMPDEELRRFTAGRLSGFPESQEATDCICAAAYDAEKHTWDVPVLDGLRASTRGDLATCIAPALNDKALDERDKLIKMFAAIHAPEAYDAVAAAADGETDPEVRGAMVAALQPSEPHVPLLLNLLREDEVTEVRAGAAKALKGRKGDEVVEVIVAAATKDPEGSVRAAALSAVVKVRVPQTDEMVCRAMMEDPDEAVRETAVRAYKGTKRKVALDCLRKRALEKEESGAVRQAVLEALGASPSDEAAKILCDSIGPWLRLYVKDKIYSEIPGSDIVKAQNNRDWENSYSCVAKARSQGGYSCYARNYLGHWFNELGGKASTPWCPGMKKL